MSLQRYDEASEKSNLFRLFRAAESSTEGWGMTEGGIIPLAFIPTGAAGRWALCLVVRLGGGGGRVALVPQGSDKQGDALSRRCRCIVGLVRQGWDKTSVARLPNGWRRYRCWVMLSSFALRLLPFARSAAFFSIANHCGKRRLLLSLQCQRLKRP